MAMREIQVTVKECTCERCGAMWIARLTQDEKGNWVSETPISCTKCKIPRWNRPAKDQPQQKTKTKKH